VLVIVILDREVALDQINHREIGRPLAVRDRAGLEDEPAVDAVRVGDFPDQTRLPHAGFPHDRHHVPMTAGGETEGLVELVKLYLAPHEAGQLAHRRGRPAPGPGLRQLVDLDPRLQALHGLFPQRLDLDVLLGEPQRVGGEEDFAPGRELLYPVSQLSGQANGRGVHVQIAADGRDHNLARVEPDTDVNRDAMGATCLLGVPANGGLHVEGGIARPDGMILMRERCAEERRDPVARFVDGALVVVDRVSHPFDHGAEELARLLRIPVGHYLSHRFLHVGDQNRHQGRLRLRAAFGWP
jgi:hypothetical protein